MGPRKPSIVGMVLVQWVKSQSHEMPGWFQTSGMPSRSCCHPCTIPTPRWEALCIGISTLGGGELCPAITCAHPACLTSSLPHRDLCPPSPQGIPLGWYMAGLFDWDWTGDEKLDGFSSSVPGWYFSHTVALRTSVHIVYQVTARVWMKHSWPWDKLGTWPAFQLDSLHILSGLLFCSSLHSCLFSASSDSHVLLSPSALPSVYGLFITQAHPHLQCSLQS